MGTKTKKKPVIQKEKWFKPGTHTGWHKNMPQYKRRALVLKSHKGDLLASARAMGSLANVTRDSKTRIEAKKDADYFYKEYEKKKGK